MNIIWNFINLSGIWKYELPRNGQLVGELVGQTQLLWSFISMSVSVSQFKYQTPNKLINSRFQIGFCNPIKVGTVWLHIPANRTFTCDACTFTEVQIIRLLVQVCKVNRDLASTFMMRMQSTPWYQTMYLTSRCDIPADYPLEYVINLRPMIVIGQVLRGCKH